MYTSAYLGSSGNKPTLKSHELIAILYEEDRQRKGRTAEATGSSFQVKSFSKGRRKTDSDKECYNCHKKGHMAKDCWSQGGGSEGKGPKGRGSGKGGHRSNQASEATNRLLSDASYMANADPDRFSKLDWILDSGTTSHICTARDAFTDYAQLSNVTMQGVWKGQAEVEGRGTIVVKFSVEGKIIRHQLHDVLHIPDAPNCLLSISRLDDNGGHVDFQKEGCRLFDVKNQIIGEGRKVNRLYQLYAWAELPGQECANLTTPKALTWDQWHRHFRHISISGLERLKWEGLVDGLTVDESSIASPTCKSCIQAKQAHRPFPKEAEHHSEIAGERIVGDVWGPARVQSIGGWFYYVSFLNDAKWLSTVLFLKRKSDAFQRIREYGESSNGNSENH